MGSNILRDNWLWFFLYTGLTITAIVSRPPLPIDETRYLSVAWEMWQSDQFLVPHINGQPYSHKPPLLFWLIQFGWWIFGVSEWSARIVSPLFGFASIFLTKRIAAKLWPIPLECSRTSPLILLGMSLWSIFSTLTMFDMLLVFFSLASYLLVLRMADKITPYSWPLLGVLMGLGVLAKGPIIFVYIVPPIFLGPLWITRTEINWWRWYGGLLSALAIGCLLTLLWAIPASIAGGEDYGRAILFGQTVGRMVQSFAHQRPYYWYILLLPLILFPWSLWLPFWRGWKIEYDQSLFFCLCTVVPAFVILSLISGKQIHYVLPLLPIIAILLSRIAISSPVHKPYDIWPFLIFFAAFAALLFILPNLPALGKDAVIFKYMPSSVGVVPIVVGLILVGFYACRKNSLNPLIISICMLCHLIFLQIVLSQSMNTLFNPREIIRTLSLAQKEGKSIAVYPSNLADQFQFAARLTKPLKVLNNFSELRNISNSAPSDYCLILTDKKKIIQLAEKETEAIPYKDKWLLFRKFNTSQHSAQEMKYSP